jgi:hypothetical protein
MSVPNEPFSDHVEVLQEAAVDFPLVYEDERERNENQDEVGQAEGVAE